MMTSKSSKSFNYEEQINASTQRIKEKYLKVNRLIIISLALDAINLIVYFISRDLFGNYINLLVIILNAMFCFVCYLKIKNGFNMVDAKLVGKGKTLFFGSVVNLALYIINVLYLIIVKVFFNIEGFLYIKTGNAFLYGLALVGTIIFLTLNCLVQVMLLYKFNSCLKLMKKCDNEKPFEKIVLDDPNETNEKNIPNENKIRELNNIS